MPCPTPALSNHHTVDSEHDGNPLGYNEKLLQVLKAGYIGKVKVPWEGGSV